MATAYWQDKNVFVTGASGFLGSWLTETLVQLKANVVVLQRDIVPHSLFTLSGTVNKVTLVRGELQDFSSLERSFNEYEIDTIFHLGAQAIVQTANRSPLPTFESNIRGTWNVLEAARQLDTIQRIVVASSDKAYGQHKELPYSEDFPLQGKHPYDVSKSCTDLIAQTYHTTYGLPVGITRCGNIYGGGDLNFNRIIPGVIRWVHNKQQPLIRSDGTYIRDYIYVKDIVRACLMLAGNLDRKEIQGEAFNFSTKNKKTVLEVTELILRLMKSKMKPKILNNVKGEIKHQYLSSEKAKKLLKWTTEYELEQGLKETITWYNTHFKQKTI
jgi:CDP-glucose 4,6-dehydratase